MYAELHAHTNFSFLDGASSPEQMALTAAEVGLAAIGITDHDGLYGAVRFSIAARNCGVKPIIGMEINLDNDDHLTLLAKDRQGYRNLCRISTEAHKRQPKAEPYLRFESLAKWTQGLIGLSGCRQGAIPKAVLKQDKRNVVEIVQAHTEIFDKGCFFLELQNHLQEDDLLTCNGLIEIAKHVDLPLVATNNVHYHTQSRSRLQDVLVCIKNSSVINHAGRLLRPNNEYYLKSPEKMENLFCDIPEALENTLNIANMCDFELAQPLDYGLPGASVPIGNNEYTYLEKLTWEGVQTLYSGINSEISGRVVTELSYVRENCLAGYFLTVREIVKYCKDQDILVNTRGSAPGSILCYALGISMVEPISAGLLFERFMSKGRGNPPDIDLDIEHQKRERVIQHIYNYYGRDRAAMVANVISFQKRSAIRDVGKALGISADQIGLMSQLMKQQDEGVTLKDNECIRSNSILNNAVSISRDIQGFPRHLGIHSGGMIISSRPLCEVVPIEPARMLDRTVVQWDKDDCADVGLIKIDLLGLGMMTVIRRAFCSIQERYGERIEFEGFTFDDPNVYKMITAADTLGVFQIESRAQISTLPKTRPACFYDLIVEIAIIRPGPMTTKLHRSWIERRLGREKIDYLDPRLKPVLERTLGVPIFQEQCMQMSMIAAGFSAAKADELRRAMSRKRSLHNIQILRNDLMEGMKRNGISNSRARDIYGQIEGYAGYGFPEAHSCSFALLVYVSAWLKYYYPAEFLCALLNSQPMGFYKPHTLIGDAQRHGIEVRSIDMKMSSFECVVEADGAVRLGYCYIEGVGESHRDIFDRKGYQACESIDQFYYQTKLSRNVLKALATAGAFDCLGIDRRSALWQIQAMNLQDNIEMRGVIQGSEEDVSFQRPTRMQQAKMDFASMDLSVSVRGMDLYRRQLNERGVITVQVLKQISGNSQGQNGDVFLSKNGNIRSRQEVKVAGVIISRQRPKSANGYVFLTLEDETGLINVIVKPNIVERYIRCITDEASVEIHGELENDNGSIHVLAQHISAIQTKFEYPQPRNWC